jgi:hypothetical protein
MNDIEIIDEHIIIRETIGYDGIKDVELWDLPAVLQFLKVVYNYQKMVAIENKNNQHDANNS